MNEKNPVSTEIVRTSTLNVEQPAPTPMEVLRAALQGGVTETNIAVVERMSALVERFEEKRAEREFAAAFVALQAEMPKIKAAQPVPNNDGTIRYHFAPFESIMDEVRPYLMKHGFTVSFSSRYESNPERVIVKCTLQHVGGHKRENEFSARVGSGPPKSSAAQGDGAASTYAKRFALTDALNIVVEKLDTDARAEGDYITQEQADELEHRLKMINGDVKKFLALAESESFTKIHALKYNLLDNFLRMKERNSQAT